MSGPKECGKVQVNLANESDLNAALLSLIYAGVQLVESVNKRY